MHVKFPAEQAPKPAGVTLQHVLHNVQPNNSNNNKQTNKNQTNNNKATKKPDKTNNKNKR